MAPYLQLPPDLQAFLRQEPFVVLAVEVNRECSVLLKGPTSEVQGLSKATGVLVELVALTDHSPDARLRLTWIFDGRHVTEAAHPVLVNGRHLNLLAAQTQVMVFVLNEDLGELVMLRSPWSGEDRDAARESLWIAEQHLHEPEARALFFHIDPMFRIGTRVAERF